MKNWLMVLAGLIISLTATIVMAQAKSKVAMGQVWGSTVRRGEFKSNSTASTLGLALVAPLGRSWAWYAEGGLATPNSAFYPAPRTVQGPAYKLSSGIVLGWSLAYQYTPAHGQVVWGHSLGMGPSVAWPITREIGLTLVVGAGKNLREPGPWSVAFQPRLSFNLPFDL